MAKLVSEAERELGTADGKVSGELSLGVSTTIARYVLPRLLGAFLDEHPNVQFTPAFHTRDHWFLRDKLAAIG